MKHDVYLSYPRIDREFAAQLVQRLDRQEVSVWYDAAVEGSQGWSEEPAAELEAAGMLVVLFSEASNESRRLSKELALADKLGKPVVLILIEDCQPKGVHLYELADRNWINAWPEPHVRIPELVEHLVALAKAPAPVAEAAAPVEGDVAPAVAEASPRLADAYVGKKDKRLAKAEKRNDILPFVWADLLAIVPIVGVAMLLTAIDDVAKLPTAIPGALLLVGFYGAIVFPIRYYLRRRTVAMAIAYYALSEFLIFASAVTVSLFVSPSAALSEGGYVEAAGVFAALLAVAFVVYGFFAAKRAMKSFRANLRQL
jgi:hypothetical protein